MIKRRDLLTAAGFAAVSVAASAGSLLAASRRTLMPSVRGRLLNQLPDAVGAWRVQPSRGDTIDPIVIDEAFEQAVEMYDFVLDRDYVCDAERIMVSAVYLHVIAQEARFHWPEFCYSTQGFQVYKHSPVPIAIGASSILATRFLAKRDERNELVFYWMRIGDTVPTGSWQLRGAILRQSLSTTLPDGVLMRASILLEPEETIEQGTTVLSKFLSALIAASDAALKPMLVGTAVLRPA